MRGHCGSVWNAVDEAIPDIEKYAATFDALAQQQGSEEQLRCISEWVKFSLNLNHTIGSVRSSLISMFYNFITDLEEPLIIIRRLFK